MLLKKSKYHLFFMFALLLMPIAYSQPEKQTCDVAEMRTALRQALFEFFESPNDAKFSVDEIKDFLDFYISTEPGQSIVDCSGTGHRSKKAYHQMLGLAKKILKSIPKCSDGTEYGKCSLNGLYCYGGKIEERCNLCGCIIGRTCDKATNKCVPTARGTELSESEICRIKKCNDRNPCTADACNNGVCSSEPLPNGTVCGHGHICQSGYCTIDPSSSCGKINFYRELQQKEPLFNLREHRKTNQNLQIYPNILALEDLDGDKDLDMIINFWDFSTPTYYVDYLGYETSTATTFARIFFNDGDGNFKDSGQSIVSGGKMASGDIDGDNDKDIIISIDITGASSFAINHTNALQIYTNNGKGYFTIARQISNGLYNYNNPALTDIDNDKDLDLVVMTASNSWGLNPKTRIYLNDGKGSFSEAKNTGIIDGSAYDFVIFDIDNDNYNDIVEAHSGDYVYSNYNSYSLKPILFVYKNNGKGKFSVIQKIQQPPPLHPSIPTSAYPIYFGDIDGDGDKDIIVKDYNQGATGGSTKKTAYDARFTTTPVDRVYRNDGKGTFTSDSKRIYIGYPGFDYSGPLVDVDDDGDLDTYISGLFMLNDGTGSFVPYCSEGVWTSTFGDVNLDGNTDQALITYERGIVPKILLNKETGHKDDKHKIKTLSRPKITDIGPITGAVGTKITLTGSGFTDNNAIFIRGQTVLRGVTSLDGSSMEFALPDNTKCLPDHGACPIKVVNLNGISNAKPFKVTEQIIAPHEPLPEPSTEPNVTITPPPVLLAPNITSISPSLGPVGTNVILSGSGFTATDNAVALAGVNNVVTGLSSSDGVTLKFAMPQTPCEPLKACSVSVTNSRGTSNTASFTLTQIAPQVTVVQPNGGEKFIQGQNNAISWKGGKDAVQVALAEDIADSSSDPSNLIVGWINTNALPDSSITWDAKKVCTSTSDSCWEVAPGSYKILAVSENELGAITINPDGRGNFDVSDSPFTIAKPLNPTITVLAPNGGEKFIRGLNMSISWSATDIVSKSVTINLLKGGAFNLRVAANLSVPSDTGIFSIAWTVPSSIAPAVDYSIEIVDANANVRDVSDSSFSISTGAVVTVLAPNGGETWLQGFNGLVLWNFSSYFGTMAFNLLKSGSYYKALQVSQPTWWYSFEYPYYQYPWPARYTFVNITPDTPVGADYAVEVVNSYDPTVKDTSNNPFNIITLPNPAAFSGRFINRFTQQPLANVPFGAYDQSGKWSYNYTNSNGEFLINSSTTLEQFYSKSLFWTWPKCYIPMGSHLLRSPQMVYAGYTPFELPLKTKYTPVTKPEIAFGDIPFWPAVDIKVQTDVPVRFYLYYGDGYNSGGGGGNIFYKTTHYSSNSMPLNLDVWVKLTDEAGKVSYSPPIKLSLDHGCIPKVLSYFNGQFKWEPYYIALWGYWISGTEGTPVGYNSPYISGGIKPYTWSIIHGTLPPGLSISPSNGTISGTPTTAGTYLFTVKVTDSNGVSAVSQSQMQIKTPSGTIPPLIEVLFPGSGERLYQGSQSYIQWNSYNLLSKSAKIALLKGGNLYRTILSNFSQSWPSGGFYYLWNIPKDIPAGTDYQIEISDATNPSVKDINNAPFSFVRADSGSSWACCFPPSKYGQWLTFTYPGTISDVQSFKMYEKKPDSGSFNLIAVFTNIPSIANCSRWGSSGLWGLRYICGSSPTAWQAYTYAFNSSSYPSGEYAYQFTAVDNAGVESTPFITLKQYALEKITLLSPTSEQSPVNATPIFEWIVPQDWPYGREKSFYVEVYDGPYNRIYLKYLSPISPLDVHTTKTNYDGPALDPSKKYLAQVSGIGCTAFDNVTLSYVGCIAMSNATRTFWVNP